MILAAIKAAFYGFLVSLAFIMIWALFICIIIVVASFIGNIIYAASGEQDD